jgi:two-component system, response regulator
MKAQTVFLVEDDPQAVILLRRTFKKSGFDVIVMVASDGAEALEYLLGDTTIEDQTMQELPALVLLDLDLPKVHGFEVLKRLRANKRTKTLPVVILTSSREVDPSAGFTLGANSFLRKPLNFDEFSRTLVSIGLAGLGNPVTSEKN